MKDLCEKYQDWLAREDLGGAEKTELEAHLSDCPECA
ncbi:MAG: zf-HC2 domain-containing protein, partial [bacterium]|nr:zf-HC2 domain-containing protein [bacterium]